MQAKRYAFILAAGAVCLLAWGLYLTHLDSESLWYDEWFSWNYGVMNPLDMVRETAYLDVHPPVYYLWTGAWIRYTGSEDVFVMRLTSVIPAVLAVALCYRAACDWFGNRWAALAAALFLATLGIFVYFARELRMYTLVVCMGLGSWWLLSRALAGRRVALWAYAALVGVMLYTYYFTAFMVVAQAVAILWKCRRQSPRLLRAYALPAASFLPWIPIIYDQLVLENVRAGHTAALSIGNLGKYAATEPTTVESVSRFISTYTAGQPAYAALLLGLGLILGLGMTSARYRTGTVFAALWLFLTAFIFFGLNPVIPVYSLRYPLMIVPGVALLVGAAVGGLPARARPGVVVLVGVAGLLSHTAGFLPPKIPHRDLLMTIDRAYQPGDRIWYNLDAGALGSYKGREVEYYQAKVTPRLTFDRFIWDAPKDFAQPGRIWYVHPYWISMPPAAADALHRTLTERTSFGAYSVELYEAPPTDESARFGDVLAVSVSPLPALQPGGTVTVKTWWRALQPPERDYSYGLYLRDASGAVVAQADGGLSADDKPTSQWTPGDALRLATLTFTLPATLPPGCTLSLGIYDWQNPTRLRVALPDGSPAPDDLLPVGRCGE